MPTRTFPFISMGRKKWVALGCPESVPWDFLAPHEAQAQANHDQTLERLAERGGLDPTEMVCILEGWSWHKAASLTLEQAIPRLNELLAKYHERTELANGHTSRQPDAKKDPP